MNLEPTIQSEVSQKEKDKYHIAYTRNLERWYWHTYLQGSDGDAARESRPVDTAGEGEGGMNRESNSETQTLPYVTYIASRSLLYDVGSSNSVLCDNLKRGGFVGGGSRGRECMYTYGWLLLLYGRNQPNIVKWLSFNIKDK